MFKPSKAEFNPIYHLLVLLGGATIVAVSRLRVNLAEDDKKQYFVSFNVISSHVHY